MFTKHAGMAQVTAQPGLDTDQDSDANFIPVNTADHWLHFGLGVGMVPLVALFGLSAYRATGAPSPSR